MFVLKPEVVCLLLSLAVEKALFDVHKVSQEDQQFHWHTALARGQDHIKYSCFYKNLNQLLRGILKNNACVFKFGFNLTMFTGNQ